MSRSMVEHQMCARSAPVLELRRERLWSMSLSLSSGCVCPFSSVLSDSSAECRGEPELQVNRNQNQPVGDSGLTRHPGSHWRPRSWLARWSPAGRPPRRRPLPAAGAAAADAPPALRFPSPWVKTPSASLQRSALPEAHPAQNQPFACIHMASTVTASASGQSTSGSGQSGTNLRTRMPCTQLSRDCKSDHILVCRPQPSLRCGTRELQYLQYAASMPEAINGVLGWPWTAQ